MIRCLFSLIALLAAVTAMAQKVAVVTGDYTFYGDGTQSRVECERLALEGARNDAIAREFGTVVTQSTLSDNVINARGEQTFFSALSTTEVRGEWLDDIDEPKFDRSLDADGNFVVRCRVKGHARELSNNAVDFDVEVLRNGNTRRYADTRFRSGDDMKLFFKSPVDGYMVVYLVGLDRRAYTLLPYIQAPEGHVRVKHGQEYVFFDREKAVKEFGEFDELILQTTETLEHNRIYVLFSPKPFSKPNDDYDSETGLRSLPFNDFHSWLSKARKNDPSLGHKIIDIQISEK